MMPITLFGCHWSMKWRTVPLMKLLLCLKIFSVGVATRSNSEFTKKHIPAWITARGGGANNVALPSEEMEQNQEAHEAEIAANTQNASYHFGSCEELTPGALETKGYSVKGFVLPDFDEKFRASQGEKWIQVTSKPLLSAQECNTIVSLANNFFQEKGDWSTLPSGRFQIAGSWIKDIPPLKEYFNRLLKNKLFPALAQIFPHVVTDPSLLCIQSAYIFKYTPESGEKTDMHMDGSLLSFTILLNDKTDFEGGGTFFECLGEKGEIIHMNKGDVTFRPAGLRHRGQPISSGERYVLGGFVTLAGRGGCEHTRQLLTRGTSALASGDTIKAKRLFELAREVNPQFSEIHMSVAHCLRKFGDNSASLQSYLLAFQANPRNADAAFMVGVMYGELGNDTAAMEWYKKATALNEYDGDAWYRQGLILGRWGEWDAERQMYETAIAAQANHADAHCNLGVIHGEAGDTDKEISCYERTLKIEPEHEDALNNAKTAYYMKGINLYQAGDLDGSLAAFRRILDRISPGEASVEQAYQAVLQRKAHTEKDPNQNLDSK